MKDNICLSGGARGADQQWGMVAGTAGHTVVHFSFQEHRTAVPEQEVVVLPEDLLKAADEPCKRASVGIKRWFPPKSLFVKNLLRRNWYQVKDSERVYAIANITDGNVSGGTAWATQMFIDRFDGGACEAYVFDQEADGWFKWNGRWDAIGEPPVPFGVWTGIGSRDLKQNGKDAIRNLLSWDRAPASKEKIQNT